MACVVLHGNADRDVTIPTSVLSRARFDSPATSRALQLLYKKQLQRAYQAQCAVCLMITSTSVHGSAQLP